MCSLNKLYMVKFTVFILYFNTNHSIFPSGQLTLRYLYPAFHYLFLRSTWMKTFMIHKHWWGNGHIQRGQWIWICLARRCPQGHLQSPSQWLVAWGTWHSWCDWCTHFDLGRKYVHIGCYVHSSSSRVFLWWATDPSASFNTFRKFSQRCL